MNPNEKFDPSEDVRDKQFWERENRKLDDLLKEQDFEPEAFNEEAYRLDMKRYRSQGEAFNELFKKTLVQFKTEHKKMFIK